VAVASAALEAFAVAYSAHLAFWAETENTAQSIIGIEAI
jgi:hypothetical protein